MGKAFSLSEAQKALAATPALLREWVELLPEDWLQWREGPDRWSVREILAHLLDGEENDWMGRVRHVLERGEEAAFAPYRRDGHRAHAGKAVQELLAGFARLRATNLQELASLELSAADLERRALHPSLGRVTLKNLLAAWVVHDLDHIGQIARILARGLAGHVGPWDHPDYLGILHRLLPRDR